MSFLADQDVYRQTIDRLQSEGHDVATASEINLARATDEQFNVQSLPAKCNVRGPKSEVQRRRRR